VGQNGPIPSWAKIYSVLPLFAKFIAIYYLFKTRTFKTQV